MKGEAHNRYNEFLIEWYERELRNLARQPNRVKIYRNQGAIAVLGALIGLEASIRSYLHDVSTGKIKPIEEPGPNEKSVA